MVALVDRLGELGSRARMPFSRSLGEGLFELRFALGPTARRITDRFMLLFDVWFDAPTLRTRDIDLLTLSPMPAVLSEICQPGAVCNVDPVALFSRRGSRR